jgi:hypothetical protein
MPGMDRKGPLGHGPMTGKKQGKCCRNDAAGKKVSKPGKRKNCQYPENSFFESHNLKHTVSFRRRRMQR